MLSGAYSRAVTYFGLISSTCWCSVKLFFNLPLVSCANQNQKHTVKEYSSEYSDSAFKVEDTIVSRTVKSRISQKLFKRRSQNFQGFWRSSLIYPMQNMEGIWRPNFGGMGGKVETLTPHISKTGGTGGSNFFVQLGAFEHSIIKS